MRTDNYNYDTLVSNSGQNAAWHDQLKSYNGVAISYDALGNPLNYLGKVMTWQGRKLTSIDGVALKYDCNGLRIQKGDRTYYWQGNNLIMERWMSGSAENYIYYFYDESGVCGMCYNGSEYYYRKNIFGDVIEIYNNLGTLQCCYEYDAWGNHKVYNASGSEIGAEISNIGNINSIRYRGYYWDKEFGLYYLQSRYYDPLLGRFISADSVEYLEPESVSGLNLYTYCGDNPVMNTDVTGTMPNWLKWVIGGVVIVGLGIATIATGGAAAGVAGFIVAGAFKGAVIGAISGALASGTIGGITSTVAGNGFWSGFADGAADGFMSGAIVGGITGAISSSVQVANAAKSWATTGGKSGFKQMTRHYTKHVINEGQKSVAKNIVKYTKQAKMFFANNNAFGYLLREGVIKIDGVPGGIFNTNGLIRSFWYVKL
ncbi:MAG: RHS repeat-associated core domain-containing protein [Clostridia bacterium]|nr:RHS repeat-associated core domain-containing protein [Clostridia bacterium]